MFGEENNFFASFALFPGLRFGSLPGNDKCDRGGWRRGSGLYK
jgi:hypothetical protein